MKKVIYLDVGTHFGQEFLSLFGKNQTFYVKVLRRMIGQYIFRRGEKFTLTNIRTMIQSRRVVRENLKDFLFFFVEANPNIINHADVYTRAHGVFNCALTGNPSLDFTKLFLGNDYKLSQGSSIFLSKDNVSRDNFVTTLGVPAKIFFEALKQHIDSLSTDYVVVLRLNCEGVEDDVIYSAHEIFKQKLVLISGSLKDVKGCKGVQAYEKLENYMSFNSIPFVFFSSLPNSWEKAHSSIMRVYDEFQKLTGKKNK